MKSRFEVQIRHIKTNTTLGYSAVYFVSLKDGTTKEFGIDHRAAHDFARSLNAGQFEIPGAGPDVTGMLNRRAAAPLKGAKPQERCELGLFSDSHLQADLVEMARRAK